MPSPDARFDSWWEVWTTFGGILENTYDLQSYYDAISKVDKLRAEASTTLTADDELCIYIMHHTCGQSVDCECAQYLTDHRPYWQSKEPA